MKTKAAFLERYFVPLFLVVTPLLCIAIAFFAPIPPTLVSVLMALVPPLIATEFVGRATQLVN